FRLSTEVRTVIPWRLATPLSAVGAQLRINSSLVALLAGNAKKRVTSPSQARNLRFTLTFISSPPLAVSPLVLISTFSLGYGGALTRGSAAFAGPRRGSLFCSSSLGLDGLNVRSM